MLLATIAFVAMLAELAVADWIAVYLRDSLGSSASVAAFGYACFSLTMVITRFLADRITASAGCANMLRWGGLAAGTALAIGLASNTVVGTVLGWSMVGIAMAAIVPIVFTVTGNLPGCCHRCRPEQSRRRRLPRQHDRSAPDRFDRRGNHPQNSPVSRGCRIPHHRDHRPPRSSPQDSTHHPLLAGHHDHPSRSITRRPRTWRARDHA